VLNDTLTFVINQAAPVGALPFTEDFSDTTLLPAGWIIEHAEGAGDWVLSESNVLVGSTLGSSLPTSNGGALWFNSYLTAFEGGLSRARTGCFDFSGFAGASLKLVVSYMQSSDYSASNDSIQVQSSIAGGAYSRLSTLFRLDAAIAAGEGEWQTDTLDISAFAGQSSVQLGFLAGGANGSNLAIDYISVFQGPVAVKGQTASAMQVYPNPNTGSFTLRGLPAHVVGTKASIVDLSGKVQATRTLSTEMNLQDLPAGLYYIVGQGIKAKVVINK
jgi:hypothetical protein